jgi:hypothetical protein
MTRGLLLLRGENGFGAGVTLTTTTRYTNAGTTMASSKIRIL